jgi:uncharacterized protein (UPF0276 family)
MSALLPHSTVGVGFKHQHHREVLASVAELGFVEIHAENFMGGGGALHAALDEVRAVLPVSVHGVGLSIGGSDPIDARHLQRLKRVLDRFSGFVVSEHLAWSSHAGTYFNDLLPVKYDDATLDRVVEHVLGVQDTLRQQILIENPSSYFRVNGSRIDEADFLSELSSRTGCGLLLDLNNVVVSQSNQGGSSMNYLKRFPLSRVMHVHLAGHSKEILDDGTSLLIDDHGSRVGAEVLAHYAWLVEQVGQVRTTIEWDSDVPSFQTLLEEVRAAKNIQALLAKAA